MFLRSQLRYSGYRIVTASILLLLLLCHHYVEGQSNKVSSKLDFDDTEDKSNSSVPIVPGVGQDGRSGTGGRNNDSGGSRNGSGNRGRGNDNDDTDEDTRGSSGGKTGPKIHGVRVTVDTGDGKKSKESKESVEITDSGKHRKRVGIHTDITFEITADGADVLNSTSSAQRDDKEDASVPIFRGRGSHDHGSGSTHKSRKPYDPRTRWTPNFSAERRNSFGYDSTGRGGSSYYPQYPGYNVPVYTGSGDASRSAGGSIYRHGDGWNSYVPGSTYWTTERTFNEYYRPNSVSSQGTQNWKPCYCITATGDNRRRRDNNQGTDGLNVILQPSSPVLQIVDSKVEKPFSKK